jgi:hypothetical protein
MFYVIIGVIKVVLSVSPIEKLLRVVDHFFEVADLKASGQTREMGPDGFYIRRGPCADELRQHGAAGFIHCHTVYSSDGRMEPEDVIRLAYEKGAKIVAITDHVARPENAQEATELYYGLEECFARAKGAAKKYGIIFIPGVEYNIEPCEYLMEESTESDVAAGHVGIYLPYNVDLKGFVRSMMVCGGDTLDDFVDFAEDIHNIGGVIVANHISEREGIGEVALEWLVGKGAVDGLEDVNLSAGIIRRPYHLDEDGEPIFSYSTSLGLASIAAQDTHGIPQSSVATRFIKEDLDARLDGLEPGSEEYMIKASKAVLDQVRKRKTRAYFALDDFKFITSAVLEKLRIFHPLIITKLLTIGVTSPDLFSTFFGKPLYKMISKTFDGQEEYVEEDDAEDLPARMYNGLPESEDSGLETGLVESTYQNCNVVAASA